MKIHEVLFIESKGITVTTEDTLIVNEGRLFLTFIGKNPLIPVVNKRAKVWAVVRCGARYYHDGTYEEINKENSSRLFCDFYNLLIQNGCCELYKRVKDNYTDFFSGTYTYFPETVVTAADWIANERIVCGNALHLSATKEQSEQWNEGGRLLKCRVKLEDMCVLPYNILQVRCREVFVLKEIPCEK
jgi:hypothetical protein